MSKKSRIKRRAIIDLQKVIAEQRDCVLSDEQIQKKAEKDLIDKLTPLDPFDLPESIHPSDEEIAHEKAYLIKQQKNLTDFISSLEDLEEACKLEPVFVEDVRSILTTGQFWDEQDYSKHVLFHHILYGVSGPYTDEEFQLLCLREFDKERKFFEDLKWKFSEPEDSEREPKENGRRTIAEKVRIFVWRRDGGKCAKCGSREKLEYDHIIPVSKGGGNTARNIELLCEECNRTKGDTIC